MKTIVDQADLQLVLARLAEDMGGLPDPDLWPALAAAVTRLNMALVVGRKGKDADIDLLVSAAGGSALALAYGAVRFLAGDGEQRDRFSQWATQTMTDSGDQFMAAMTADLTEGEMLSALRVLSREVMRHVAMDPSIGRPDAG